MSFNNNFHNISTLWRSVIILLIVTMMLASSCVKGQNVKVNNMTIYDGIWEGNLKCQREATSIQGSIGVGGLAQDIRINIRHSKITKFQFDISDLSLRDQDGLHNVYPEAYFNGTFIEFPVKGEVRPNGKISLTSTYMKNNFIQNSNLFGDFDGKNFILRGLRHRQTCKTQITRSNYYEPSNINGDSIIANVPGELEFGNYHALLIGINQYPNFTNLEAAINDAKALNDILFKTYGFRTKLLLDPTRDKIIDALSNYRKSLKKNDNLLIYYAGHGKLDNEADQGYWLPSDATNENESRWLSNATLTSSIRAMKAKHVMVISDSCFSGKILRGIKVVKKADRHYSKIIQKKARTVMTSGGLEPVQDKDGNSDNSVFASALIKALSENTGTMYGSELFSKILRPVTVQSDQTPEYADLHKAGHDGGDFLFHRIR